MTGTATPPPVDSSRGGPVADLLAPLMHPRRFPKGSVLWRRGDAPDRMVLVRSGHVKIYRLLPGGRAVTLFLFGPGEVFGFLPLLDGTPYPGTAEAVDDVDALILTREGLIRAIRSDPDLGVELVALLGRRLRASMDTVQRLCSGGVKRRVAAALLDFVEGDGPLPLIRLPVSAQEFAGVVGVAPETLSRTLTCLEDGGILDRQGRRRYRVLDLDQLRSVALSAQGS